MLSYPDESLLVRCDHPKYLNLILAVTFLYQLQRPVRNDAALGDYIETTLDDIAIANELAHELFGHSLDDLSRPGRELLRLIAEYVAKQAGGGAPDKVNFNRRELREAFKWGDTRCGRTSMNWWKWNTSCRCPGALGRCIKPAEV